MRLSLSRAAQTFARSRAPKPTTSQAARTRAARPHERPALRANTAVARHSNSSMWPVGTWDDPVPIVSTGTARVVGCTGPSAHSGAVAQHETVWITVEKDKLCQCPSCRQVFKLELRES